MPGTGRSRHVLAHAIQWAAQDWALPREGAETQLATGGAAVQSTLSPAPQETAPPCQRLREEPSSVEGPPPLVFGFQQSGGVPSPLKPDLGKHARLIHDPEDVRSRVSGTCQCDLFQ